MKSRLTISTTPTGVDLKLFHSTGQGSIALPYAQLLDLYEWLTEYREAGFMAEPFVATAPEVEG